MTGALRDAGLAPDDAAERERFLSLVRDAHYQALADTMAKLEPYASQVRDELGDDADPRHVIALAQQMRELVEAHENVPRP